MRDVDRYLPARVLQTVGIVTFIGSLVFWAVTDRQSSLFVGLSVALIMLGRYPGSSSRDREDP